MQAQHILYFLVWAGFIFFMMRFGSVARILRHTAIVPARNSDDSWTSPDNAVDPDFRSLLLPIGERNCETRQRKLNETS